VCYEDSLPILDWLRAKHAANRRANRRRLRDGQPLYASRYRTNSAVFRQLAHVERVGYRKPHPSGYKRLLGELAVSPDELLFVGDEEKDVVGAARDSIRAP